MYCTQTKLDTCSCFLVVGCLIGLYSVFVRNKCQSHFYKCLLSLYTHCNLRDVIIAGLAIMDMKQSANSSLDPASNFPILCSTEYGSTDSSPTAEHGSCADDAENIEEDISSQEVVTTTEAPSSSVRSISPDLNCPICLGRLENRSYTDTCFHKFCFVCLVEWSKVKPVCPLCKQSFTSVIHNVQSYENFEQLPITSGNSRTAAAADSNGSRFRYPTTVIRGSSERRRQRDSLRRPSRFRHRGSSRFDVPPTAFTSSFRRSIYRDELWVRSVEDSGRYRDASAAFFARNPAAVHRLMPWLNRELMALLRNPADVSFLLEVICSTVLRVDITGETFYDLVAPFIGARTRHFVHEFHMFARSPFSMEAYDTRVIYERPPQIASNAPIEFSDSSSSNSSDADIVEIDSFTTTNDDEHVINESIFSVGESMEDVNRRTLSPQPGPSHLQDIPLPSTSTVTSQSHYSHTPISGLSSECPTSSSSDRHELNMNMDGNDEDSGDDVEIVSEDKPWRDRSPLLVSSSDTDADADNVVELLHQATSISSSAGGHLSADATQDISPNFQHRAVDTDSADITELVLSNVHMNTAEISIAALESGSTYGSKKSSHQSKHYHKRVKMHKHRHYRDRDSSHYQKDLNKPRHSSSGQSSEKHKHHRQRLKPSDDNIVNEKLKQTPSATKKASDSCLAENRMWLSDDSCDSPDHQSIRSVVVVPQTFKKNSTGHKRSTTDSS